MRFPFAVSAAAVVAIAIAACSGGQQSPYTAPPAGSTVAAPGAITLGGSGQAQSVGAASGVTGTLTYVGGSGTVTAGSSATAPAGTTAVVPADRVRVEASSSPTSPNVYYVTITSTAGASLQALPQVNITLAAAAVGTFQEAQFTGGAWANIATGTPNSANTAWTFAAGKTPITIPAGGSIFLAFYQGNFPNATPSPVGSPTDVLAQSTFTTGVTSPVPAVMASYPAVPTTGSWTQCTINGNAPNAVASKTPAFSTFTPAPTETVAAFIEPVGSPAPAVGTPAATQTSVPGPGVAAAVLGGSFVGFGLEDFRYSGLCQVVTIPHNPQLNMNVFAAGNQKQSFFDFEVDQLNSSNQYVSQIYVDPNPIASPAGNVGDTQYRSVSAPTANLTPLVGQTITLFVGIYGDGHGNFGAYYFVNNIQLLGNP